MWIKRFARIAVPLAAAGAIATGCGGGSSSSSSHGPAASPGALSAEAGAAATGDIPDNQNFLVFKDPSAGFSMKYPEGWAQKKAAGGITFRDKNNLVRVDVHKGTAPTAASVKAELSRLGAGNPSFKAQPPTPIKLRAGTAIKVTYTTESAPNSVTGKRVTLMVDRYELASSGKVAVIDLGTPAGVDNVDAYRLMSQSFTWL
jgi:hypothetical protein